MAAASAVVIGPEDKDPNTLKKVMRMHTHSSCRKRMAAAGASVVAAVAVAWCVSPRAFAQAPVPSGPRIAVAANVQVSRARSQRLQGELEAASDPQRPGYLLACALIYDPTRPVSTHGPQPWGVAAYLSKDGGRSWEPTLEKYPLMDPTCAFGPHGTAYLAAFPLGDPAGSARMFVYRSPDGGQKWLGPAEVRGMDRPFLVADKSGSKYAGNLYLEGDVYAAGPMEGTRSLAGLKLYVSKNSARSFGDPVQRIEMGNNGALHGNAVVLSDGTLVILETQRKDFWAADNTMNFASNRPGRPAALLRVVTSDDGGRTLTQATTVADDYLHASPWRTPGSVIPWIAADHTNGPFKDRLYVVWSDRRSGRDRILLTYSPDRGKTWSQPTPIDDDRSARAPGRGPDDMLPVVAVNDRGVVGVAWYDRRGIPDDLGWNVRFRASLDGGVSWLPSVKVSAQPQAYNDTIAWPLTAASATEPAGNVSMDIGVNLFLVFGGDTSGMAVDSQGLFHPVWLDNRTGIPQVWTSAISVAGSAMRNGDRALADLADVSDKVKLNLADAKYDRATGILTVTMFLTNGSKQPLPGPFVVRVGNVSSYLGVARVANADNHLPGPGAIWRFAAPGSGDVLATEASSEKRQLLFRLSGVRPFAVPSLQEKAVEDSLGLLHLDARVLAPVNPK